MKPELTKHQKFQSLRIKRSEIKNLPLNPRTISANAKKRLKKFIERVGLLGPVNYNTTTGHVYGGNQRLAVLDALEGGQDYLLDVAAAKLTPKQEARAVTGLNSQELQGDWDLPLLAKLLGEDKQLDPEDYGFSQVSLDVLLGEEGKGIFAMQSPETESSLDDLNEMNERDPDEVAAEKNAAVERRHKMKEKAQVDQNASSADRVAHVGFKTTKELEAWMVKHGESPHARYISAKDVP
jgi:hypothetical protein